MEIEELRRRAKDNKAKNVEYYLTLGFNSIKELRTVLFALPTAAFGYVQSGLGTIKNPTCFRLFFVLSVISGLLSYFLFWTACLTQSNHYSDREKILSEGWPDEAKYKKMIKKENKLVQDYKNYWFLISSIFIIAQFVFAILSLATL